MWIKQPIWKCENLKLLIVYFLQFNITCANDLVLIDEGELLASLSKATTWDLVIQNPFPGIVAIAPSPLEKFQILLNISCSTACGRGSFASLFSGATVTYKLKRSDEYLGVEIFPAQALPTSTTTTKGTSNQKQVEISQLDESMVIYLRLLFVTVASLVLVVFAISLIFSCWWVKNNSSDGDAAVAFTEPFYYIILPREEAVAHANEPRGARTSTVNCPRSESPDEPELIELLPRQSNPENEETRKTVAQIYVSPTTAYATLLPPVSGSPLIPITSCASYPLPHYVVAGGNTASGAALPVHEKANTAPPQPAALATAPVANLASTDLMNTTASPSIVPDGGAFSPRIAYVQLAATGAAVDGTQSSLRMRTLPTGRRHIAKEFLDETMLATISRRHQPLPHMLETAVPAVGSQVGELTGQPVSGPSATLVSFLPSKPLFLLRPDELVPSIPSVSGTSIPTVVGQSLAHSLQPASLFAAMSSANASVPAVYMNHPTIGALGVVELIEAAAQPNLSTGQICESTVAGAGTATPGLHQRLQLPAGSQQTTSGALFDPEYSGGLLCGVCQKATCGHRTGIAPALQPAGLRSPISSNFIVTGSNTTESQQCGATTSKLTASSSDFMPTSITTPMVTSDVPLDLLVEMASCPQHHYLVQVQTNSLTSTIGSGADLKSSHSENAILPGQKSDAVGTDTISEDLTLKEPGQVSESVVETISSSLPHTRTIPEGRSRDDQMNRNHDVSLTKISALTRNRLCPDPPRRGVSLQQPKGGEVERDTSVESSVDKPLQTADEGEGHTPIQPEPSCGFRSATLNRNFTDRSLSLETDDLAPGSSATLPSSANSQGGGRGGNRRSALKSADRPDRPKVSKHLRFTTLTLITFVLLLAAALGDRSLDREAHRWNVIRPPHNDDSVMAGNSPTNRSAFNTFVHVTIWLPSNMRLPGQSGQTANQAANEAKNTGTHGQPREHKTIGSKYPDSIQLWLNASSRTEVWLDESIERHWVHVYDAVNANNMLSSRVCRQRYACEHSCDPGSRHDCICQRGYRPAGPGDRANLLLQGTSRLGNLALDTVQSRICLDVDECASPFLRQDCARLSGVCTNRPGDYVCLCPSGRPCLPCSASCPTGYWASGSCERNQPIECIPCSGECPTGMYQVKTCGPRSDRVCRPCRPLCISQEFEFTPCKGKTNRICKPKDIIPEIVVPYKKNIWFENLQRVRDVTLTLSPDDVNRLPRNKSLTLDRHSGYQVLLEFDSLNLLPVLGPVDHSDGNDNVAFLASAAHLDQTQSEELAQSLSSRDYHWSSSSTAGYRAGHQNAYTLKANATLWKFCPYPVPPLYRLGLRVHRNVTVATVPDASVPGHRPILASCKTYRNHGHFPSISLADSATTADDLSRYHSSYPSSPRRLLHRSQANSSLNLDSIGASVPLIACLEPARLPAIFGVHWNRELSTPRTLYYEEKQLCGQLKQDCQHCLATCAEQLKTNSLKCRPTANPADNGRSPRLEICFDCCAKDNCSDVCDKYPAHRCHTQLCSHGLRLDFPLQPEWPKQGEFLCHVHPASSRLIYRFQWSLLYQGRALTQDKFPAALLLPTADSPTSEAKTSATDSAETHRPARLSEGGRLSQVYRNLLRVDYHSGLKHLPDLIGGTDTMQSAYFWSKQTIPLVADSAAHARFDPMASTASATGAIYANTMQTVQATTSTATPLIGSLQVWPNQPFGVNTAAWARLTGAPCAAVDPLLDQLNVYTPSLPPYIAMGEVKVEYVGNYLYTVSHTKNEPKLSIDLPRGASLLGAVFSPASVERGQYLHASLVLAWLTDDQVENSIPIQSLETPVSSRRLRKYSLEVDERRRHRYWIIDLTGQVDQLPGIFRLRVFSDGQRNGASGRSTGGAGYQWSQATVQVEDPLLPEEEMSENEDGGGAGSDDDDGGGVASPDVGELLLDYDVGVFEERKFQLRILIPGPLEEPDYEKVFRLVITDTKNRLDIRVKRTVQSPEEMAQRHIYERQPDYDSRPALVDLLPSLAARQQAASLLPDEEDEKADSGNSFRSPHVGDNMPTDGDSDQFGPPPMLVYSVVGLLLLMMVLLLPGLITEVDPNLTWMKPTSTENNVINDLGVGSGNGDRVALVTNPMHGYHNSSLSRWFRVCILMGYLCCKSAYTFGVTLTALVIVIRCVTQDPAGQLMGLPEWIGLAGKVGEVSSSSRSFTSTVLGTGWARQKLLEDEMDIHLRNELSRQHAEMRQLREACDRGLDRLFDQLENRLSAASALAASRRSRVLLSQAVAELARAAVAASTLQLAEGLLAFNQSADWAMQRLHSDLVDTERALANSDWLTGARIIYAEVVRLRRHTPDPSDATRSFLAWAKLAPTGTSLTSLASGLPQLTLPSQIPILQPHHLLVPTPPKWMSPTHRQFSGSDLASSSYGTDDHGTTGASRLDLSADEPEYGPKYIPFVANAAAQLETLNTLWSSYEGEVEFGGSLEDSSPKSTSREQASAPSGNSSGASVMTASDNTSKTALTDFQLSWVHVLGAALLLDALWLIHRVLHTVDTAERLLYGEAVHIDLTEDAIRRRLSEQPRIKRGCKRAFEVAMQPGVMRKMCASTLALLAVTQCAAHADRLLSQEMLDYIGYYDNLVLPVHLRARFVNVQVSRSAKRLNDYELTGIEAEVSRRLREAQFLLHHYTDWLNDIEQEQCRLLLTYKEAAQHAYNRMNTKLVRNPSLGQINLPIEVGTNPLSQTVSFSRKSSHTATGSAETAAGGSSSLTLDALVPRHCRMTRAERDQELVETRRLDAPNCQLTAVVPHLFKGYNVSEYLTEAVKQSESWLMAARSYIGRTLYCIFVYVSSIVLWNAIGSVVWFYINRFNILPKRLFFESDYSSWRLANID